VRHVLHQPITCVVCAAAIPQLVFPSAKD
jgi:hypothetical protein